MIHSDGFVTEARTKRVLSIAQVETKCICLLTIKGGVSIRFPLSSLSSQDEMTG